jgi:hypothetical protein
VPVSDPELDEARHALERGDFFATRRLAAAIVRREGVAPELAAEARKLLAATSNDPLALALGVGCLLFFIIVVFLTLGRS